MRSFELFCTASTDLKIPDDHAVVTGDQFDVFISASKVREQVEQHFDEVEYFFEFTKRPIGPAKTSHVGAPGNPIYLLSLSARDTLIVMRSSVPSESAFFGRLCHSRSLTAY